MTATFAASVDLASNVVTLGAMRVALEPAAQPGRFRLPEVGSVCAVTFGERSALVTNALAGEIPAEDLIAGLRKLALEGDMQPLADAVLLVLAGGGEEAPSFAECIEAVSRHQGLDWQSAQQMGALEVDRCTAALAARTNQARNGGNSDGGGWTRFEFVAPADTPDLHRLCAEMAARLLARGVNPGESIRPERMPDKRPRLRVRAVPAARSANGEVAGLTDPAPAGIRSARAMTDVSSAAASANGPGQVLLKSNLQPEAHVAPAPEPAVAATREQLRANDVHPAAETGVTQATPARSRFARVLKAPAHLRPVPDRDRGVTVKSGGFAAPASSAVAVSLELPYLVPEQQAGEPTLAAGAALIEEWPTSPRLAERDWLYEVALALADECDLRGLNA
jgi:hypothetical protein